MIAEVNIPGQDCGQVDAVFTQKAQVPIAVLSADCVPILLAHREGTAVAAVHAGWKGVKQRILQELWKYLKLQGHRPQDWVAAIGPAIGPCCYQVSEELAQEFKTEFSTFSHEVVAPSYRMLDLPGIEKEELINLGIGEVELLRACTRCSTQPEFPSFRRQGKTVQNLWSVIVKT